MDGIDMLRLIPGLPL